MSSSDYGIPGYVSTLDPLARLAHAWRRAEEGERPAGGACARILHFPLPPDTGDEPAAAGGGRDA